MLGYYMGKEYYIRTMSGLVSTSIKLLVDTLRQNNKLEKDFMLVEEAVSFLEMNGLKQPSITKYQRTTMSLANEMGHEDLVVSEPLPGGGTSADHLTAFSGQRNTRYTDAWDKLQRAKQETSEPGIDKSKSDVPKEIDDSPIVKTIHNSGEVRQAAAVKLGKRGQVKPTSAADVEDRIAKKDAEYMKKLDAMNKAPRKSSKQSQ
jgi:hypothetical protein